MWFVLTAAGAAASSFVPRQARDEEAQDEGVFLGRCQEEPSLMLSLSKHAQWSCSALLERSLIPSGSLPEREPAPAKTSQPTLLQAQSQRSPRTQSVVPGLGPGTHEFARGGSEHRPCCSFRMMQIRPAPAVLPPRMPITRGCQGRSPGMTDGAGRDHCDSQRRKLAPAWRRRGMASVSEPGEDPYGAVDIAMARPGLTTMQLVPRALSWRQAPSAPASVRPPMRER